MMISSKSQEIRYRYLRCGCCNWRICDVPNQASSKILPYREEQRIKDTHLVLKCKKCKSKNIVIIK